MNSYYEFLMYELKDIEEEFDIPSHIAHEVALLFSLPKSPIPETFYRLYISPLSIDYSIMYNALSYFSGAGFVNIDCDCISGNKSLCDINGIEESAFYEKGAQDALDGTTQYRGILDSVSKLRGIIFNDC